MSNLHKGLVELLATSQYFNEKEKLIAVSKIKRLLKERPLITSEELVTELANFGSLSAKIRFFLQIKEEIEKLYVQAKQELDIQDKPQKQIDTRSIHSSSSQYSPYLNVNVDDDEL